MKILVLIFFILYIISGFACNNSQNVPVCEVNSAVENSQNLQSNFDQPILEVTSNFWGLTWMNGKILDIRLFEDGIVEYDSYPTKVSTPVKAEEVKAYEKTKISEEQLKDFIDFLTSNEFLSAKNKYTKRECISYDAGRNIEIKFNYKNTRKQIEITGYCDILPEQISRLLEKIEKITKQRPA